MRKKAKDLLISTVLLLMITGIKGQSLKTALHATPLLKGTPVKWQKPIGFTRQGKNIHALAFENVSYLEEKQYLPYLTLITTCDQGVKLQPAITVIETAALSAEEEVCVNKTHLTNNFEIIDTKVLVANKVAQMHARMVPVRINKETGKIEKLLSYEVTWSETGEALRAQGNAGTASFATSSVLSTGTWFRIGTTENAIYKIDRSFLQNLGLDITTIDPRNIKIYGNGGEILGEDNSAFHYDDLAENAIYVQGESDGTFDAGDYVLFYGQAPDKWNLDPGPYACARYQRNKHYYSDTVFYFLIVDNTPGKRIQQVASANQTPTTIVNSFDDPQFHEVDAANLIKSGRELYGESFENQTDHTFGFSFPNIQADTIWIKTSVLGRRVDPGTGVPPGQFDVSYPVNGSSSNTYPVNFYTTCPDYDCDIGKDVNGCGSLAYVYQGTAPGININVHRTYSDETGWMNYLWVIARRALTMIGNQMSFMDYRCIAPGSFSQFNITSSLPGLRIWNVSDGANVYQQLTNYTGTGHSFITATDTLQRFIAFDGTNYRTPSYSAKVENQNLHAMQPVDYIIVAYPGFVQQAEQLGQLHEQYEKYTYKVVTPQEIYNEFSSGAQDITAIRLFVRMLYKRASSAAQQPKQLLLYGDGSYLYKITSGNTNLVPTFQTYNSSSFTSSKCGDDFYGLLDDNEGTISSVGYPDGLIDIGIGRLPVHSTAEANTLLNKIQNYYARNTAVSNSCCDGVSANAEDWRNWVCFVADDANPGYIWETTFVSQSELFAATVSANRRYNIDKIYEDAYKVVSVPGGRRYPDVVTAINNRVQRGALIIGYSGHGGELGLSHEEIITINQIQSWSNINNMPLFFTATCEFSRFDDPSRTSAGEYIILNPNGGGIALFTTTRLAYASDGQSLGPVFYPAALNKLSNGKYPTLGDIIKKTKQAQANYLHFSLLGDPALTLSYPKEDVSTSKINTHVTVSGVNDTLSALGKYTISGFIADTNGNKITSFNGTLYPTIFDKPVLLSTLDNGGNGSGAIIPFFLQKNALYRGKTTVTNGDFQFTCIIPKDIFYNYGAGKFSYYAQADTMDAAGYDSNVIIGGTSSNPVTDNTGPSVKLFINNNQFVPGGITNENPFIYAEVSDSSGINTTGNGLGHDLVGTLDGNSAHAYVLNDYYQADLNKYQSGKVKYQMSSLAEGTHHLTLKVWDILNNSSTGSTDFVVAKSAEMALAHVLNYPNPFSTSTNFFVEHNQACDLLDVEVQVFTITGKVVKTLQQTVKNEGFRTEGIHWDGRDDFGDKLGKGVYIYKVTVRNNAGSKADKIEKLVILN